jgi:superfamily II DNA/RNA helicase
LKQKEVAVDTVKQFYMDCKNEQHKSEILAQIYGLLTIGQSIIFVRMRRTGDELAAKMVANLDSRQLKDMQLPIYTVVSRLKTVTRQSMISAKEDQRCLSLQT